MLGVGGVSGKEHFPICANWALPSLPLPKLAWKQGNLRTNLKKNRKKITSFGFQDILSLDARLCVGRDIFNWNEGRGWVGINHTMLYHTIPWVVYGVDVFGLRAEVGGGREE